MHHLFSDISRGGADVGGSAPTGDPSALTRRTQGAVRDLESRLDRLTMICCAMWTIIQAQSDVSDDELVRLVRELDMSDGEMDGKARLEQVVDCASCGRPVGLRHSRCLYCGTERQSSHPFEDVL